MKDERPFITVSNDRKFYFLDPDPDSILIEDIAKSLSNLCRFNGHAGFYSVAQHSVLCSRKAPLGFEMEALLHDATEAYIGDMVTPLKRLIPDYKKIENCLDRVIRFKFGLPLEMSPEVKEVDIRMVLTEKRDILNSRIDWGYKEEPYEDLTIYKMSAEQSYEYFMNRYQYLVNKSWLESKPDWQVIG